MASVVPPLVYTLPLSKRTSPTPWDYAQMVVFNFVFLFGILGLHAVQLALLPAAVSKSTVILFEKVGRWTQGLFARLLVLIAMIWAPTVIRLTVDEDDDTLDLGKIVQRNEQGIAFGLDLPDRMVLMSNHQVYCDWSYIWNLLYFASLHQNLIILLKASLKWVPVVGPAMQIFHFIFMHRNWAADKVELGRELTRLGQRASRTMDPFVLLIFPEGTLVSPLTRPPSEKYANKIGIADCRNCLLPRSTGLLFCLRSLSPRVPTLHLVDATIAYPGIPKGGYGQDYFSLQSIFGRGAAPPVIHMHLKSYNVKYDLPIGRSSLSGSETTGADSTEAEKKEFDDWLLQRWREKDARLDTFHATARLSEGRFVDIPIQLKSPWELFGLLVTAVAGLWILKKMIKVVWFLTLGR